MLTGDLIRLRFVQRFGTCAVQFKESVAEHSYYTAMYAMLLCEWLQENYKDGDIHRWGCSNTAEVLRRALIHDVEEARTGDCPRPFKHGSASLLAAMQQGAAKAADHVLSGLGEGCEDLRELWLVAKDPSLEGRVLEFADYLSVLGYCALELGSRNETMLEHIDDIQGYARLFHDKEYDFMRALVEDADELRVFIFKGVDCEKN